MNFSILTFALKGTHFFRTLWAFPVFLVFTLIPWLLSSQLFEYARTYSEAGRRDLGEAVEMVAYVIVALTGISTGIFCAVWLGLLARAIATRRMKFHAG